MPNGFWYAGGDCTTEHAVPASAFSKGDLILYDSNSSFSRVPWAASPGLAAADIAGVADADSDSSINNKVTIKVPQPDTLWWASLATNLTSDVTPGTEADINFAVANSRYYVDTSSANTVRAVVVRGTDEVDQSVQSKVLVKLIYHAGNLDLS